MEVLSGQYTYASIYFQKIIAEIDRRNKVHIISIFLCISIAFYLIQFLTLNIFEIILHCTVDVHFKLFGCIWTNLFSSLKILFFKVSDFLRENVQQKYELLCWYLA